MPFFGLFGAGKQIRVENFTDLQYSKDIFFCGGTSMNLKKVLYTVCVAFFTIFILSAILVLTNTLNMWLAGIVSLSISIICCVIIKIMKKKSNK